MKFIHCYMLAGLAAMLTVIEAGPDNIINANGPTDTDSSALPLPNNPFDRTDLNRYESTSTRGSNPASTYGKSSVLRMSRRQLGNSSTSLDLRGRGSTGSIEFLGEFTTLQHLDLGSNKFTGSIEALGKLTKLSTLSLDSNQFTGSVNALGKLTKLTYLNIRLNSFTGSVEALGKLTKLTYLNIRSNSFTGSVDALGKLTKLSTLSISLNSFTGSVDALGKLTELSKLFIYSSQFTGSVEALGKLTKLTRLYVHSNQFTGSVNALGKLTKLEYLHAQKNQFTGSVETLGKLTKLEYLYIYTNQFTGSVNALGKLTKLRKLYVDSNQFTGSVNALGKLTKLTYLDIDSNQFTGSVEALGKLTKLTRLYVVANQFTGSVNALGELTKLSKLKLSSNRFTGSVEALGTLTKLSDMSIGLNSFTGSVETLGKLTKISDMNLNMNRFTGSVEALGRLTKLSDLSISSNQFTGSVNALGKLTKLTRLFIYTNQFTGSVNALGELTKLSELYIDSNQFTGSVNALGKLTKLSELSLDSNQFTGSVEALGTLTKLEKLKLDHNAFEGSIGSLQHLIGLKELRLSKNKFTGTLHALGLLKKLTSLVISSSGSFTPPVPKNVFDLAAADLHDLGLSCKWLPGDGMPSLDSTSNYLPLNQPTVLKCPDARFPVLSNETILLDPVLEKTSSSCAEAGLSVIPIKAECQKAVTMLSSPTLFADIVKTDERAYLPYCSNYLNMFYFETQGVIENRGFYTCNSQSTRRCICNRGRKYLNISCVYRGEKAQWEPSIDKIEKLKCLGYGACRTNDATAIMLRTTSGADVRTCSTLQDGDHCVDFKCTGLGFKSQIRNPQRNKIRCKFNVWNEASKDYCVFCPPGEHKINEVECEKCSEGKYLMSGPKNDNVTCIDCPPGKYQPVTGQIRCIDCANGHFQDDTGQVACKPCASGQYQSASGNIECDKCPAGQYQRNKRQSQCVECEVGRYQPKTGESLCISLRCEWYFWCAREGISEPFVSPLVFIIPLLSVASIFAFIKVVQLVIKAVTAWKPQSKAEAALAKKFVLPKKADDVVPSVSAFKVCENHFVARGWTDDDLVIIEEHRNRVVSYLGLRVKQAANRQQVRIMRSCMNMDVLHDFKTLYDATMKNIRNKEPSGFKSYTRAAQQIQAASAKPTCPRNPSALIDLYNSGRAAYSQFHAFIAKAAQASGTAFVYKSHGGRPGMKGIYRVLEKGVFKYNDDWTGDLDLSQVRDLVRGGIIDTTMEGLAAVAHYILASNEVTVCRGKDRFNEPSPAGWTDLMINFYRNDDPGKHVCEVQLMHFKMHSQRTTQEGHDAYNIYRAAAELLVKTYVRSKSKSQSKSTESRNHSSKQSEGYPAPNTATTRRSRSKSFREVSPYAAARHMLKASQSFRECSPKFESMHLIKASNARVVPEVLLDGPTSKQ